MKPSLVHCSWWLGGGLAEQAHPPVTRHRPRVNNQSSPLDLLILPMKLTFQTIFLCLVPQKVKQ